MDYRLLLEYPPIVCDRNKLYRYFNPNVDTIPIDSLLTATKYAYNPPVDTVKCRIIDGKLVSGEPNYEVSRAFYMYMERGGVHENWELYAMEIEEPIDITDLFPTYLRYYSDNGKLNILHELLRGTAPLSVIKTALNIFRIADELALLLAYKRDAKYLKEVMKYISPTRKVIKAICADGKNELAREIGMKYPTKIGVMSELVKRRLIIELPAECNSVEFLHAIISSCNISMLREYCTRYGTDQMDGKCYRNAIKNRSLECFNFLLTNNCPQDDLLFYLIKYEDNISPIFARTIFPDHLGTWDIYEIVYLCLIFNKPKLEKTMLDSIPDIIADKGVSGKLATACSIHRHSYDVVITGGMINAFRTETKALLLTPIQMKAQIQSSKILKESGKWPSINYSHMKRRCPSPNEFHRVIGYIMVKYEKLIN